MGKVICYSYFFQIREAVFLYLLYLFQDLYAIAMPCANLAKAILFGKDC